MHSFEEHSLEHSIDSFEFSILKRTPALNLHREEFRYIEKLRTKAFGLNHRKVIHTLDVLITHIFIGVSFPYLHTFYIFYIRCYTFFYSISTYIFATLLFCTLTG